MTSPPPSAILAGRRQSWALPGEEAALIGREHERRELGGLLETTRGGTGGLVLLAGEAGVGKTRLAEELVRDSGLHVMRGDCSQEAPTPYGPIVAALRSLLVRMPDLAIDLDGVVEYPNWAVIGGWAKIPATFTPGVRVLDAGPGRRGEG